MRVRATHARSAYETGIALQIHGQHEADIISGNSCKIDHICLGYRAPLTGPSLTHAQIIKVEQLGHRSTVLPNVESGDRDASDRQ